MANTVAPAAQNHVMNGSANVGSNLEAQALLLFGKVSTYQA